MSLQWLWSRSPLGWTAIDCQGGLMGVSVKLPAKPNDRAVVLHHAAFQHASAKPAELMRLMKTLKDANFPLIHVLGHKDYQMFLVDKAAVRPEEMESSLRWTVTPLLDYPAAEANLSWMDIPKAPNANNRTPQMYVIASRRDAINQRMDDFERANMSLQVMDIRETGQRNISAALHDQDAAVCLIFADESGVQLTVTYKGELHLERYIRESLFEVSEDSETQTAEKKFDRVALEVQRSIDFVHRNASYMPFDGIYVAPTLKPIMLQERLQARLLTDVKALDLHTIFEWPADSDLNKPEVQALYFNVLGASLRLKE